MSEAMNSVEIEDVLSSIRRLVSEDLRPASRPAPVPRIAEPGHKLILTPALRVVSGGDDDLAEDEVKAEAVAEWADDGGAVAKPKAEGAVNAPITALPEPVAELHSETAAPCVTQAPALAATAAPSIETVVSVVGAAVGTQPWEDEADDAVEAADWPPEVWPEPAPEPAPDAAADAALMAALEEPLADAVEDAEVVTSASPAAVMAAIEWGPTEAWGDAGAADAVPEPMQAARNTPEPAARLLDDLAEAAAVAEIRNAEAGVGNAEVDPIPHFRHAGAQASRAEPSKADAKAPDPALIGSVFDQDDSVLDEEVLRELVRDIIREELQGALGERITRNVRKLVRVEINRALTSREFDGT